MRFRNETTRHDRSFNLACQILANSVMGNTKFGKRSLRLQIRERLHLPGLDLTSEPWHGDFRATGDAANLLGIKEHWKLDDTWLTLSNALVEHCKNYLSRADQESADLFDRAFIVERKVTTNKGTCKLRLTRLEDGLKAGSIVHTGGETHFFSGIRIEHFGASVTDGLIEEVLKVHYDQAVSMNPTSTPLTEEAAKYISQMIREGHIRYPHIRSRRFLVKATIVNVSKASPRDQADMLGFVDQLNSWADAWTKVNGYSEPETFSQLIKRSYPR